MMASREPTGRLNNMDKVLLVGRLVEVAPPQRNGEVRLTVGLKGMPNDQQVVVASTAIVDVAECTKGRLVYVEGRIDGQVVKADHVHLLGRRAK